MTLESSDQNGAKKRQIWKVLHFHLKNSDKIRNKIWMVLLMLGYCLHGLCALPNMVINAKIMKISAKSQEKEGRQDVYLLIMLRYNVHGLCTFPNMVINGKIMKNQQKVKKKRDMMCTCC